MHGCANLRLAPVPPTPPAIAIAHPFLYIPPIPSVSLTLPLCLIYPSQAFIRTCGAPSTLAPSPSAFRGRPPLYLPYTPKRSHCHCSRFLSMGTTCGASLGALCDVLTMMYACLCGARRRRRRATSAWLPSLRCARLPPPRHSCSRPLSPSSTRSHLSSHPL
jgi:hypothetical protein